MTPEGEAFHSGMPHDPAEVEPRRLAPDASLLVRGAGLAAIGVAGFAGAVAVVQKGGWLLAPVVAVLAGVGVLGSWGAVVHLSGGEKFDDHPWV